MAAAGQVLTVAEMQAAEQAIIAAGTSIDELMHIAGHGAAEWVWRIAGGRGVTVLCGPGNNGGDGYVIAETLRQRGIEVQIVAPVEPMTDASSKARSAYRGQILTSGNGARGRVLVDCLFGSGLARPLSAEHELILRDLAGRHDICVAIDLPSGVESDSGALLNGRLPKYDATLALGAWKFAHWCLPARTIMGERRLVPIGVGRVEGAAQLVGKPKISAPAVDAHKYTRGLCAIVGGAMLGATLLSADAAMRGGAGYVKLLASVTPQGVPHGLVVDTSALGEALADGRIDAILAGPGLGRDAAAKARLQAVLVQRRPAVLDADALMLLTPAMLENSAAVLATPHDGELDALCRSFAVVAQGRQARAQALAKLSGMVVLAKGPDTIIAAPDGRVALAQPTSSWLSVAGSGDVLAGISASRMANGADPFLAACQAVWLHGRAAQLCGPAFTADELAQSVSRAVASAL